MKDVIKNKETGAFIVNFFKIQIKASALLRNV